MAWEKRPKFDSQNYRENTIAGEISGNLRKQVGLGLTGYVCICECAVSIPYIHSETNVESCFSLCKYFS